MTCGAHDGGALYAHYPGRLNFEKANVLEGSGDPQWVILSGAAPVTFSLRTGILPEVG